jgi:5-methylcytosine-specific restriction endonuclease McrA
MTAKAIPAKLRALVLERDGYACARCRQLLQGNYYSLHHRLPRGRGGKHTAENLVTLCGSGTMGCHGDVESHRQKATDDGWLVPSGFEPSNYPILRDGVREQPTATGWELVG